MASLQKTTKQKLPPKHSKKWTFLDELQLKEDLKFYGSHKGFQTNAGDFLKENYLFTAKFLFLNTSILFNYVNFI